MKKLTISLFAITALLFTGCFIDSDTATVRINLGNMPVAKVEKKSLIDRFLMVFSREAVAQEMPDDITAVYLGAFDSNNQLLAKKNINVEAGDYPENNIVSFDVPARSGVTIVVLGEDEMQEITYYGKNVPPINLTAGTTETVSIEVFSLDSEYINLEFIEVEEGGAPYWDKVIGASSYDIYDFEDKLIQSTQNNYYNSTDGDYMYIMFNFAGSKSSKIYIDW